MESQVRDAIYDYMLTGTGLDASNVFWNLAPQDTAVDPVIVISIVTNPQFRDTLQSHDEQFLQFSIFGKNLQECETLETVINGLWDKKTDTLENLIDGNNKIAGLYRQHRDQLRDDKDYWHLLSRYKLELNSAHPNGVLLPEMAMMTFYPGLEILTGQDNILIEFDLFMEKKYLDKPRPDGTNETYKAIEGNLEFLWGAGFSNDYMEIIIYPGETLELYTNNVYIYHEFFNFDVYGKWQHVRIFIDFTTLPNATLTFEFDGQTYIEDIGEVQTIADWEGPWNFAAGQLNTPRNRLKMDHENSVTDEVINPAMADKLRPLIKFRNFAGDLVPKLETAYSDLAKTERAKVGQRMYYCDCEKSQFLESSDNATKFVADGIDRNPNGNFNDYSLTGWTSYQIYPFTGGDLPTFEIAFLLGIRGYGALHGITTAAKVYQGCLQQFGATAAGILRGMNIRNSLWIYVSPLNRKAGSNVKVRLWHDQVNNTYITSDFEIEAGKWFHVYQDQVNDKTSSQTVRYGIYFLVDDKGPIEFWIEDVKTVQVNSGYIPAVL